MPLLPILARRSREKRTIVSGLFTVGHPELATGKANMVYVKCDLCTHEELFNPEKENPHVAIERIERAHVCTKTVKEKPKKRQILKQTFGEYEIGSRRHRLGPEEKIDDTV
jgi:hypothetical protein